MVSFTASSATEGNNRLLSTKHGEEASGDWVSRPDG
jgi:hypothetical protein